MAVTDEEENLRHDYEKASIAKWIWVAHWNENSSDYVSEKKKFSNRSSNCESVIAPVSASAREEFAATKSIMALMRVLHLMRFKWVRKSHFIFVWMHPRIGEVGRLDRKEIMRYWKKPKTRTTMRCGSMWEANGRSSRLPKNVNNDNCWLVHSDKNEWIVFC